MKGGYRIIINTCEAMEEKAIAVLNNDGTVPPLFCVGARDFCTIRGRRERVSELA